MLSRFIFVLGFPAVAFFAAVPAASVVLADEHGEHAENPAGDASGVEAEASGGGESHADSGHHDGGHESGVPGWKTDLALWSLITFVCFLFVLRKAAWGPLISALDQREAGIRDAIAQAEENHRKSQALLAEYEEKLRRADQTVADMIEEARRDAERTGQEIVAKAQADVEAMRQRTMDEIARAKDAALAEVFESVDRQIAAATEHVLGRALTDEDQERLIQEALAEISGQ